MDSLTGIVESPYFIGAVLFLGIIALARVLLSKDPALKRNHGGDRRRQAAMPAVPFYDSEGIYVTEDRRITLDRRRSRVLEMENLHQSHSADAH